jgi:hypothetical protein
MKGAEAETHALPVELDTIKDASPAPWKLHEGETSVVDNDGHIVATCGFLPKKSIFECKTNAKLISSAPELLDALYELVIVCEAKNNGDFSGNIPIGYQQDILKRFGMF